MNNPKFMPSMAVRNEPSSSNGNEPVIIPSEDQSPSKYLAYNRIYTPITFPIKTIRSSKCRSHNTSNFPHICYANTPNFVATYIRQLEVIRFKTYKRQVNLKVIDPLFP